METKDQIRQRIKKARLKLAPAEAAAKSRAAVERCIELVDWPKVKTLHAYLPIAKFNEINTWPLLEYLWDQHPAIMTYVPVGEPYNPELSSLRVTPSSRIKITSLGIPEPVEGKALAADAKLDVIIVPLVAFDRSLNRLGYGSGYFDRFLIHHPQAQKIGLGYDGDCVASGIPAEPWDVPLNAVVTESRIYKRG